MPKFSIFSFALVLLIGNVAAQAETWQSSPGQVQVPIWPGAVPDAISAPTAESVAPRDGHGGWLDPVDPICNSTLYARALDQAGVPAEVHLFAKGGHAFGLRDKDHPVSSWPTLVENWLKDIGML